MDKMTTLERLNTRIRILRKGGPNDQKDASAIIAEFMDWFRYDTSTIVVPGKLPQEPFSELLNGWREM